jgi:hypothetical protein
MTYVRTTYASHAGLRRSLAYGLDQAIWSGPGPWTVHNSPKTWTVRNLRH